MNLRPRPSDGFTLFEVILATSIFVLLAGSVYFSVSSSVSAADALGREQIESRRLAGFADFLRSGFRNLPAEAAIAVRSRRAGGGGDAVELVIRGAAGAFQTGVLEGLGGGVVLSVLPDGRGFGTLSLMRFPDRMGDGDLDRHLQSASWLPVLSGVAAVRWRFWDAGRNQFFETWERSDACPDLIELTLQCAGNPAQTCLFALPGLAKAGADPKNPPQKEGR